MENIFENAKFGDKFRTRDGKMAIIVGTYCGGVSAMLENESGSVRYYSLNDNGKYDNCYPEKDIVDKWQEPINEQKLDRLANEYVRTQYPEDNVFAGYCRRDFKAGYRKAKGE